MKHRNNVYFSTIVAALGGLLFGFDAVVISGANESLQRVFELNGFWLGFTVASALIGTIIGAIAIGKPGDAFGRRRSMIVLAVFYFVSAVGSALATDWYMFLIFRFLGGLAVGGCTVLSPMYIAEIAPTKIRGRLVAVNQLNIVLGILLASSILLCVTSQRGLYGIKKSNPKKSAAGKASTPNIHLHAQDESIVLAII